MAANTISEARAAEMIQAADDAPPHRMAADLCAELSATAIAAEARVTEVQKDMSDDSRKEFDATRAFVTESLTMLTRDMDAAITKKFDAADDIFKAAVTAEREHLDFTISDLTTQWDFVDGDVAIQRGRG